MNTRNFKAEGQSQKAEQITALIDEGCVVLGFDGTADAERVLGILRGLSDEWWLRLQQATGNPRKDPPSQDVRSMVLERFERRIISGARFDEVEEDGSKEDNARDDDYRYDEEWQ